MEASGVGAYEPISVPGALSKVVEQYADKPALAVKQEDGHWRYISYK
jgi:hypothetical protein